MGREITRKNREGKEVIKWEKNRKVTERGNVKCDKGVRCKGVREGKGMSERTGEK